MDDTTRSPLPDGSQSQSQWEGPASEPATVEVVEAENGADDADAKESVTHPSKLIRIASMVRTLLDEVRSAPLDDAGRQRMRQIHERSLQELESVLSEDLQKELAEVVLPFSSDSPSESELRIAQAQLVGWLEGLFHGIQTALFAQQMAARQQLEQMRRGLPPGAVPQPPGTPSQPAGTLAWWLRP
jgi:hypothetical protein